jgi:hypothetical protein
MYLRAYSTDRRPIIKQARAMRQKRENTYTQNRQNKTKYNVLYKQQAFH